jgi:hypothetical protein
MLYASFWNGLLFIILTLGVYILLRLSDPGEEGGYSVYATLL